MWQIAAHLTIADIDSVRREDTSSFDAVVSVCQDTAEDNVGCDYEHYKLADGLPRGHAGRSRSAAVAVAAYAVWMRVDYREARAKVEDARPEMAPNHVLEGFARQYVDIASSRVLPTS
jgi:predicted protein tyrosine phosphatase